MLLIISRRWTPWIKSVRALLAGAMVVQLLIILVCVLLVCLNNEAGGLKYRLPNVLFWIYFWTAIGAPLLAAVTLLILWFRWHALSCAQGNPSPGLIRSLLFVCLANVLAVALWFSLGGMVFFCAGGSR